jgi:hypothetical protein
LTKKGVCIILILELIMSEIKPKGKNAPLTPQDPNPPSAGTPAELDQTQHLQSPEMVKATSPNAGKEDAAIAKSPAVAETKPTETQPEQAKKPVPPLMVWVLLSIVLLLLVVIFFFISHPQEKRNANSIQAKQSKQEEKTIIGDDAAGISKNLFFREPKYSEIVLTDDAFAGQASRSVRTNGPVISQDIDPQLAALADAFKKRLEISQGSQMVVRGNALTKITKGEFHGFKINAIEKIVNQNVVSTEITIMTPKRGVIKTVNHVLEIVKETDFSRAGLEIQDAGLEFFALPDQSAGKTVSMQLRSIRFLGKPVSGELLISGKSVGGITLGMPIVQMEKLFVESHVVLKRKILANDIYFDVYKILDQSNEPLFYVYENKGKVWGISLISEVFKTDKNIGIGSSLGMMRINYPFVKLGYSEKKTPIVQLQGVAGLFIIQGDGVDFSKKVFPNENKVISILIGDSPEFE